jgi:hypothetical protein
MNQQGLKHRKWKYRVLSFLLVAGLCSGLQPLQGQANLALWHQALYWLGADFGYRWGGGYEVSIEAEERRYFSATRGATFVRHQRILPNVYLSKRWGAGWRAGLGQWLFTIARPQDPARPVTALIPEHRTYLRLRKRYRRPGGRYWQWRLQSEYRLFRQAGGGPFRGPISREDFRQRLRFSHSWPLGQGWRLAVGDELHLRLATTGTGGLFQQNRVMARFSRRWGAAQRLKTTLGFIQWWQPTGAPRSYYSRYIFRFQVGYRLGEWKRDRKAM